MNKFEDALAIFNDNNYCFVILTRNQVLFEPYAIGDRQRRGNTYPEFNILQPLNIPEYTHVGWVKTYQKCIATYTWPWKLLYDASSNNIVDSLTPVKGVPLANPPLSLYKSLIDTEFDAVYIDSLSNEPVYINLRKEI